MSENKPTYVWINNYRRASNNLSLFVVDQAHKSAAELGFGWEAQPEAPSTYESLTDAFEQSVKTGGPLPVSSLYCDDVIHTRPSINHAMRFWHDTLHVETGLTFSLDDELELGMKHLQIAEVGGITKGSTEWEMLRIDLLGQNYLLGITGRFPINQRRFVRDCLLHGLDEGVLLEARREV